MKPSTRALLERGRALFNAGNFFQAHEVWEEAWKTEGGDIRSALQGLIQIAAALLKASRSEKPGGCAQLLAAGLEKLASAPGDLAGLDLVAFGASVEEFRARAAPWLDGRETDPPRKAFPQLLSARAS